MTEKRFQFKPAFIYKLHDLGCTARQIECAEEMLNYDFNMGAAQALGISHKTIKYHLGFVARKLAIPPRVHHARFILKEYWKEIDVILAGKRSEDRINTLCEQHSMQKQRNKELSFDDFSVTELLG